MVAIRLDIPRDDIFLGLVIAENVDVDRRPFTFDALLSDLLERRRSVLSEDEEARRLASRDMLRNGRYKPTGRAKPASEYLLRAASRSDYVFPRINGPVDVCNYLSLREVLPVSLWDADRARTSSYVFRLGREGEAFVFNDAGQTIDLEDLLVGCRVGEGGDPTGEPIVNPVKDSLATKTTPETRRVAACIYAPAAVISAAELEHVCSDFSELLSACGDAVGTAYAVVRVDTPVEL